MSELEKKFLSALQAARENRSSDIHLMAGQPAALRTSQGLAPLPLPPFTGEEMKALCQFMVTDPKLKPLLQDIQDIDGSFEVKGFGRYRFNIYRTAHGITAVLRVIPQKIPSIEDLGLPPVLKKIAEASRGLILVTGATGSGKSSTLAAMINHINENEALHMLTIEDPIEFLHPQKKSRLSQREIGRDTASFAKALKSALRQDPDVILVGEMRDHETLDIALKASETGHLVFSTVHTSDAMKTVGRLISLFPPEEQNSARIRLADNLHAIVSQRLIPANEGGRVVAQEILINNLGIQDCIANEKKTSEIPSFIEKGKEVSGMQTFDQHLADLAQSGKISVDTAIEYATNPSDFQRNLSFGSISSVGEGKTNSPGEPQEAGIEFETYEASEEVKEDQPSIPPTNAHRPAIAPLPSAPASGTKSLPIPPKIPKPPGAA